ncbi:MAG: OB-fold nucleic acid binding domain-containing protein [Candidatus Aenigmatarchaeota archaeon]
MSSVDEIIEKIIKESKNSKEEIKKMIEEKQDELSGLVSEEGAAYIIGRELGISLLKNDTKQLKIKNVVSGIKSIDLLAKIVKVDEPRNFDKKGKKGQVLNVHLADETGTIRLTLWNDEIDLLTKLEIKEEDVIKISGGYVRDDNRGTPNIMLGRGKVEKVEEEIEIPEGNVKQSFDVRSPTKKMTISEIKIGDYAETRACLVQLYKRNPFYEVCPTCGTRLLNESEKWVCKEHGVVEPKYNMVLSGVIDDGKGNIRAVFFREQAEKIVGESADELKRRFKDPLELYENVDVMGKEFIFSGFVKHNDFTESNEIIVNNLEEVDLKKEINEILQ